MFYSYRKVFSSLALIILMKSAFAQHSLVKLPHPVNTEKYDEINPIVSNDNRLLYFTRLGDPNCNKSLIIDGVDLYTTLYDSAYLLVLKNVYNQISGKNYENPLKSNYNQDIWYAPLENHIIKGIYHPEYPINNVLPNSICSSFGNSDAYLVINQFDKQGGMNPGFSVTNHKNKYDFTFPKPIDIRGFEKVASEINLTSSIDSSVLIISMESNNKEDMDLFVSFRIRDLEYSVPINMGNNINSIYNETTPILSQDKKKMYFSSDRSGGFGGRDIYVSERLDDTFLHWSVPIILSPPVNSKFDESFPFITSDNDFFYFNSNRSGSSDIYQARLKRDKIEKELIINISIIDGKTGKKSPGELLWGDAYGAEKKGYFASKDGKCRYKFFENKPISFMAKNRSTQSDDVIIDPQELIQNGLYDFSIELILYPDTLRPHPSPKTIENNQNRAEENFKSTILNNIYFERSKPTVLPESYPAIEKLAATLQRNPNVYISIIGHTDNVGDETDLKILSEQRAQSIRQLLVENGIASERITYFGYGGSRPIAPNDTEENKSKNRRVEIKIVAQ
jgi:OmpA-OmpF porin, OOP family